MGRDRIGGAGRRGYLQGAGGELDADGGLGLEAELVAGEAGEDVGLADAGVADEHDLEEVVALVHPVRHPIERARTQAPSRRRGAVLPGGTPLARRTGRDSIRPLGFSASRGDLKRAGAADPGRGMGRRRKREWAAATRGEVVGEAEGGGALSWTCLAVDLAVSRRWTAGEPGKGNAPCPSPSVGGRPDRLRMISLMGLGSSKIWV